MRPRLFFKPSVRRHFPVSRPLRLPALAPRNSVNVLALLVGRARPLMPQRQQEKFCAEDADGAAYAWQASSNGPNLTSGNKLLSLPPVSWTARGGLPVAFALSQNSRGKGDAITTAGNPDSTVSAVINTAGTIQASLTLTAFGQTVA